MAEPTATEAPSGAGRWLPGVQVLRAYQRSWLPRDLVAGIVLTALLVPAGMGYAEASGLPAIYGLYATIVPLVAVRPRSVRAGSSSLVPTPPSPR